MNTQNPATSALITAADLPVRVTLWEHIRTVTAWLDDAHPRDDHETACRVMKLAEETGEAVNAYLGMTGQNPRKGTCATLDDLNRELCDVITAALVALATVNGSTSDAAIRLNDRMHERFVELADRTCHGPVQEWGCECCGDAWIGVPPDDGLCPRCHRAGYDS